MSMKMGLGMFVKAKGGFRSDSGFHASPKLPDGKPMKAFEKYNVRLLRDFDGNEDGDRYYKKGEIIHAMTMPHGKIYLSAGTTFETDAVAGRDFEFLLEKP